MNIPSKAVNSVRRLVQAGAAAGLTYLFYRQDYARASRPFFTWLGWLDPLAGLAASLRGRWPALLAVSLAAMALAVWRGRLFCGWLCPVGFLLDLGGGVKKLLRLPDRPPAQRGAGGLETARWLILGAIGGLVLAERSIVLALDPLILWPRELSRIAGGLWPWGLTVLLVSGLLAFPRFWCRFLCPAGGVLGLAARLGRAPRTPGKTCRRCGLCVSACPMRNIAPSLRIGSDCLHCAGCAAVCPAESLAAAREPAPLADPGRRDFLLAASAGLAGLLLGTVRPLRAVAAAGSGRWPRLLRPPGALTEAGLAATCSRCGQCVQVCPSRAVVPAGLEAGLAGLWTPRFVPRRGQCMFCMACGMVCPTGSLIPVPVASARLGTSRIDREKCLAWKQGTECLLCIETCPTFALSIVDGKPVIDTSACNGCGACEAKCPVAGSAVVLTNAGEIRRQG